MKLPKAHLSYTQLTQFADCPAYWKALHVDGLKQASTGPMRLGGAVHDLIARHLMGLAGDEAQVLAAHELSPSQGRQALEIFSDWLMNWADTAEGVPPKQIEDTIEFEVATQPAVRFQSRLDFWRIDGDGMPVLYDWKSSYNLPADSAAEDLSDELWDQLLTYAVGFRRVRQTADRYGLKLVLVRYNRVYEYVVDAGDLDRHEEALIASCQSVLLAVQAQDFERRPSRACATCPVRSGCDFSNPTEANPDEIARAFIYHREAAKGYEVQLRHLCKEEGIQPDPATGVLVGYKPSEQNKTVTRQVNKVKQILGTTESGEEVWVEPVKEPGPMAKFGVHTMTARAVGARTKEAADGETRP